MNGQQKAQENVNRFAQWVDIITPEELKQIVYRGQLNRGAIAKGCGFAKSVLRQNPEVKKALTAFEEKLRTDGVLPPVADEKTKKTELYDQSVTQNSIATKRASKLEIEVIALRAENESLKAQLERYKELGEVLADIGMMPQ